MGIEENKELVRNFMAMFGDDRVDEAFALTSDDFHWKTWGTLPFSGYNDKATVRNLVDGLVAVFPTKPNWEVESMIAEADTVAVQCHTYADTIHGFPYRNHYHLAVTIRHGKIAEIKEYMDTMHCMDLVRSLEPAP